MTDAEFDALEHLLEVEGICVEDDPDLYERWIRVVVKSLREAKTKIRELEGASRSLIQNIVEHGSHDNWKALSKAIHYFDETSKEATE